MNVIKVILILLVTNIGFANDPDSYNCTIEGKYKKSQKIEKFKFEGVVKADFRYHKVGIFTVMAGPNSKETMELLAVSKGDVLSVGLETKIGAEELSGVSMHKVKNIQFGKAFDPELATYVFCEKI